MLSAWLNEIIEQIILEISLTAIVSGAIRIILIIVAAHIAIKVGSRLIDVILQPKETSLIDAQRAATLRGLLHSMLRYAIDFVAVLTLLLAMGLNITPILAGAGVLGLAVGFGAQNLVRDVITGFFLLFEDQMRVGEYVETAGVSGIVEETGLRLTRIRDYGGQLHFIPNGLIESMTNHSRGPMRVMFEVAIAHEADLEKALEVLQDACRQSETELKEMVEGPMVLGVNSLSEFGVNILIWGKALPGTQWQMARVLRQRLKLALEEADIEIPFPRQVRIMPMSGTDPMTKDSTERA